MIMINLRTALFLLSTPLGVFARILMFLEINDVFIFHLGQFKVLKVSERLTLQSDK